MSYTLISFVGTGIYKENSGYEPTEYIFEDLNKRISSSLFMKALLETKHWSFDKIILVGTTTSAWDILCEQNEALWLNVYDKRNKDGIGSEDALLLQNYLTEVWNIPVLVKCHVPKIDDDTSAEIFNIYNSIIKELDAQNVLFDITHSFRSMPVLMYQTLQYSLSQSGKNVELIYGEFQGKGKPVYVRDLSQYWKYSQITEALSIFKTKLDGTKLADLIKPYWEDGAKSIKSFTGIVQTNYALQFPEVAKQIKNALTKYPESAPAWLNEIKSALEEILKLYDEHHIARTLLNYADYLYEHKLNTQAIISLQVTVETAIAEKYGSADNFGDYDWWQEKGKGALKNVLVDSQDLKGKLGKLENTRNQIAHGGSKNRDKNGKPLGFPGAEQLPDRFRSGKDSVKNLLSMLKL